MINRFWFLILFVLFLQLFTGCSNSSQEKYGRFENRLETGRTRLNMPAISASIVKDKEIVWAKGFGLDLASEDEIKVKHLITHTAQGRPGSYYQYSGYLYGYLDQVIEKGSDDSHSFNRWNSTPPDFAFYGIALYSKI